MTDKEFNDLPCCTEETILLTVDNLVDFCLEKGLLSMSQFLEAKELETDEKKKEFLKNNVTCNIL